ncbi:MAG: acylphosphatase [Anaerolineales bacterium]|nr:acylphosphatase [Anaerolineales bacterium]
MTGGQSTRDDNDPPVRLHVMVDGRVQGVGFRYFVAENALALGLTGWVRNRWNGAVEVVAEGKRAALEMLLSALQRGPRSAFVTDVSQQWLPATGEFSSFRVRPTE